VFGPVAVICWQVYRLTPEQICLEDREAQQVEAEVWAQRQGVILCDFCRERRHESCLMASPMTCAEKCQRMWRRR